MKIDTGIGANLGAVADRAWAAEEAGLDCLWASETTNDPFLSLALVAEHSEQISLGTAIAIAFARNPMSLAYTTNQLQEYSKGRMILGLGSQVRAHIERRFSSTWSHPAARMREYVLALRAAWASFNDGAALNFQGEFYTHTLMTPLFAPRPHRFGAPKVFLAAVGPRMTEVAGEVADGVITHGLSSARYVRQVTLPALERGLAKSGRTRAEVEVTCPGFIAVAENDEQMAKARSAMRRQVAFYSSTPAYLPVLEVHGWGELQPELYARSKRGAWDDMSRLVDDEMVDTFTIIATPETLASEVRLRYAGIADRINAGWWRKAWWPPVGEELPLAVSEVGGFTAPGFEAVADLMSTGTSLMVGERARSANLGSGGGAFAAYVDGECVVDLWSGFATPGVPWVESTRAVIMSATKGLSSLCAHVLFDRGELDLDAPVVHYWPEFEAGGKEGTLVRHLLSHQSGAIGIDHVDRILSWDGSGWGDGPAIAAALAASPPAWEPGTRHGYHGVTFGWLVGELVHRISGHSLGAFFQSEVAQRLGLDCRIGTPPAEQENVAMVMEWAPRPGSSRNTLATLSPDSKAGRSVLAGPRGHLFADEHGTPRFATFMNTPAVLAAEIGAINATATVRGLAATYAALAQGESLVSRASTDAFSVEQVCGKDAVMRVPTRWALGYTKEPPALIPGLPRQHGPNDEAFGHMGAGGQVGFADPVAGVGCAFVRNHLENQAMPLMGACLVDTFYRCLGTAELRF